MIALSDQAEVLMAQGRIEIYVNYSLWRSLDAADERGIAISCAELARRKLAPVSHIADAFGITRQTIYNWMEKLDSTFVPSDTRRSARDLGDLGLSNRMVRFVRQHLDLPDDELVDRVWQEFRRPLDVYGVRRLREAVESRQRHQTKPPVGPPSGQRTLFDPQSSCTNEGPGSEPESAPADPLPEPTDAGSGSPDAARAPEAGPNPVTVREPQDLPAGRRFTQAAGLTLALPFIHTSGLVPAVTHLAPQGAVSALLGSVMGLVGLSLSAIRAPEGAKEVHGCDFAPFTGDPRGLRTERELRDMSRALAPVAPSLIDEVGGAMARNLSPGESETAVYVDGHFLPYSGKHRIAHGYSTRLRQALTGHMVTYLHLRCGSTARPMVFAAAGGDDPFRPRIVSLAERYRNLTGCVPMLVFDRGGSGWDLFDTLVNAGQPFVSYVADGPAVWQRAGGDLPTAGLTLVRGGKMLEVKADRLVVDRGGRKIYLHAVRFDAEHKPVVVATSDERSTQETLSVLWGRWGIENSFKLYPEFGLNHLGVHGLRTSAQVAAEDPDRLVVNPARGKLLAKAKQLEKDLLWLEDHYGVRTGRRGVILGLAQDAPSEQDARWAQLTEAFSDAKNALETMPTRMRWADMVERQGREAFDYGPKMVQDLARVVALNAEHWLRDVVQENYPNPRHERRLSRALLHAPGTYEVQGNTLAITVRPPDRWRQRQAAQYVTHRLTALALPHPLRPDLTLKWSLGAPV